MFVKHDNLTKHTKQWKNIIKNIIVVSKCETNLLNDYILSKCVFQSFICHWLQ